MSENFDEFGKSDQSLTNQYTPISAFSMKMSSNLPKFILSMYVIAVRIRRGFSLQRFPVLQ